MVPPRWTAEEEARLSVVTDALAAFASRGTDPVVAPTLADCGGSPEPPPAAPIRVTFLGTGAALPSKYRNVSSTYVAVNPGAAHGEWGFLLDAGEGTLGQLRRRFGFHGAAAAVASLAFVYVSHIHADHHLGLVRILAERQRVSGDGADGGGGDGAGAPLLVFGPPRLRLWLEEVAVLEPHRPTFRFVLNTAISGTLCLAAVFVCRALGAQ